MKPTKPLTVTTLERRIRKAPPVRWRALVDRAAQQYKTGSLSDILCNAAVDLVRLAAYVNARDLRYTDGSDKAHQAAVKASNSAAAVVRKALGFAYPKDPRNF